jgi:hypothetical protein
MECWNNESDSHSILILFQHSNIPLFQSFNLKHLFLFSLFFLLSSPSFAQNEDKSELAQVMVKMLQYIKAEKTQIEKGKKPQPFPNAFTKIYTSTPTLGKKLLDNHTQLSDNFLALLKSYYEKKTIAERKTAFNLVVQSCLKCHQNVCPGPIPAIEKNMIN